MTAIAFPTGAGACPANRAAVGAPHTTSNNNSNRNISMMMDGTSSNDTTTTRVVRNGSLDDGGIDVYLGGVRLDPYRERPHLVRVGEPNTLLVRMSSSSKRGMKGFLVRLGRATPSDDYNDLNGALLPKNERGDYDEYNDNGVRVEDTFCPAEYATGLTHTDSSRWSLDRIEAQLQLQNIYADLMLDVTVVLQNTAGNGISEYYYSQYRLQTSHVDVPGPNFLDGIGDNIDCLEYNGTTKTVRYECSGATLALLGSGTMTLGITVFSIFYY